MAQTSSALKQTPLNSVHRQMGARMVDFGGWDMPVQYSGIVDEHHAVRRNAGIFDVSHMGEIIIRGPQAFDLVNYLTPTLVSKLKNGQAQYSALLYEHGGFVDDILVHKVNDTEYFLCVNASNQDKDYAHILEHKGIFDAEVDFASERYALLATQGPRAIETLSKLTTADLNAVKYYHFIDGEIAGIPARLARTGYTGEAGFETYVAPDQAEKLWKAILEAGQEFGLKPAGLGARNTLRLEAAMALYGHEITASINPFEAGLTRIVKFEKEDFVGRAKLLEIQEKGVTRLLTGFEMTERGIGRDGYEVFLDGNPAGWVTSGGPSPTLNKNIGLCYVPVSHSQPGRLIQIMIRNQPVDAVTRPVPFYKRAN
ncbi:MAG: glycine cleavage system aminomethyltransferase GcvT [Bryobacterales bacterium]|nr:glycine cleavage system aminomethyltransferase GcvT [Bryobacterales bacterium]